MLIQALLEAGMELAALIGVSSLPANIRAALPIIGDLPPQQQTLLLVGNSGQRFWQLYEQSAFCGQDNPVDAYSCDRVDHAINAILPRTASAVLYPDLEGATTGHMPLQLLGELAGWHQPSPLGMGIHPERGLWFAYRALVLLDIAREHSVSMPAGATSVCASCESLACIETCPVDALAAGSVPDMVSCTDYRLGEQSPCQRQCLARNACPVGTAYRYANEQIEYHYTVSLDSIKRRIQS